MIRFSRSQVLPIGVDIGFGSVKLLQLEITQDLLKVVAAAREPMPAEAPSDAQSRVAVAVQMIRRMLAGGDFRGKRVITCLPRELVHMKNLRLPPMPPDELAGAMQFEAKNLFPFDTGQAAVRWLGAGEVRHGAEVRQELIVLAAKTADIEQHVEQLHRGGLVIESLDHEPCALYRSAERFLRRKEDEQDVFVLADVGFRRTTVVIGRGHDINFIKSIEIGGMQLRDAVARKLDIGVVEAHDLRRRLAESEEASAVRRDSVRQTVYDATRGLLEELAREIALCLRYHSVTFRGQRAAKVRVSGAEAADPQVLSVLSGGLPIPVEVNRSIQNVDYSPMRPMLRQGAMSEWAVAMGLCLKATNRCFGSKDGRPRGLAVPVDASVSTETTEPAAPLAAAARAVPGFGGLAHA